MTWFNTSYLKKKKLTIDHTKVSTADQSSFPMPVVRTDTDLKVTGSGGQVQNSSGFDIIFVDSTETTQLDHEIEKYVSTTGEIEMWVRIPTASHTVDTIIYMYYNNSSISTSQENKTGVWDSSYKAVWHLKEATGTNASDSTSNALTATQNNSPVQGAGQIDGSLAFNGTTQYLSVSGSAANITGDKTIETWIKPATFAQDSSVSQRVIANDIDGTNAYVLALDPTSGFVWFDNDSSAQNITSNNTTVTTGIWYHVVGVYTASSHVVALYINGSLASNNGGATAGFGLGTTGFNIGRRPDGVGHTDASLDEIRVSNVVRTAGWIATSYNAQNSPSTFYSVGAMESQRVIPSTAALLQTNTRTITSTTALLQTSTRTITSTASLDTGASTSSRTIPSTVALLQTSNRTVPSTAALLQANTRTIPSTVALLQPGTRNIPSTAALLQPGTRNIPSTVALLQTSTRAIPSTSALLQTNKRTIPSSVSLGSSRVIPSSVALLQRQSRTIFSSASLASAAPVVTPTVNAQLIYVQQSQLITASGNSGPLTVGYLGEISLDINITGKQGTSPTIQFYIDRLGTDGVYYPIYDSTSISAAPMVKSASTGAGLGSAASFAGTIRVRWVIGGPSSPGWTYSLSLVGK
jgi:hypothetical protein